MLSFSSAKPGVLLKSGVALLSGQAYIAVWKDDDLCHAVKIFSEKDTAKSWEQVCTYIWGRSAGE